MRLICAALEDLHEKLGGDSWNHDDAWRTSAPLSEWFGVVVDSEKLVNLELLKNGLKGMFYKPMFAQITCKLGSMDEFQLIKNLRYIQVLNLSSNKITGKIL